MKPIHILKDQWNNHLSLRAIAGQNWNDMNILKKIGRQFYALTNPYLVFIKIFVEQEFGEDVEPLWHVQEVFTHRGGTIMIWGGINIDGRTDLIFPNGLQLNILPF